MANGNNKLTEEERKQVLFYFNELKLPMKKIAVLSPETYEELQKIGKKVSGNILDGKHYHEFPKHLTV